MKKFATGIMIGVIVVASFALAQDVVDRFILSVWDTENDTLKIEGSVNTSPVTVAASSYTLTSASKASDYLIDYTATGTVSLILGSSTLAIDGRKFTVKDIETANTNNITISTEGAELIDGSATYVMDADLEAVTLITDGTGAHIVNGYLE